MVRIAIVEDNSNDLACLKDCLQEYEQEQNASFSLFSFSNPLDFLEAYRPDFDLVFLDIELPLLNGIETARRLRALDSVVALVFITNMEQYAVNGYEVDALDFVVKPINYYRFSSMMRKALRIIARKEEKEVVIYSSGNISRIRISHIYYVEVRDHLLIYHTDQGRMESWGKLSEVESDLAEDGFARCSTSYLVNLRHVASVEGNNVSVAGTKLPVSQRRRKPFLACVTRYLSGK